MSTETHATHVFRQQQLLHNIPNPSPRDYAAVRRAVAMQPDADLLSAILFGSRVGGAR